MTARGITVPIVFVSGYQAGEELPEDDRHAFVPKPFTPDALVAKVPSPPTPPLPLALFSSIDGCSSRANW